MKFKANEIIFIHKMVSRLGIIKLKAATILDNISTMFTKVKVPSSLDMFLNVNFCIKFEAKGLLCFYQTLRLWVQISPFDWYNSFFTWSLSTFLHCLLLREDIGPDPKIFFQL